MTIIRKNSDPIGIITVVLTIYIVVAAIIFTFDVGDDANIDPMDVPNAITSSVAWPVLLLEEVL